MQGRNRQYRQGLYQTLLRVYLRPKDESHNTLIRPALELLNAHGADFDAAEVWLDPSLPLSLSLSSSFPPPTSYYLHVYYAIDCTLIYAH